MTLDLGDALTDGASRAVKRNGLLLFVLYLLVLLLATVGYHTVMDLFLAFVEQMSDQPFPPAQQGAFESQAALALPIGWGGAIALLFVAWILQESVNIVSDRTFVSDETTSLHEPARRFPFALINVLVAVVVIQVLLFFAMVVGVIALIIGSVIFPVVLAVLFFFTRQEIVVQDKHFIDALVDSVKLTKGNRVEVFALALILWVLTGAVNWIAGAIPGVAGTLLGVAGTGTDIAGAVLGVIALAAFSVFNSAVAAQAYRQLVADKRDGEEQVGALTADDLERSADIQQENSFGTVDFDVGDGPDREDSLDGAGSGTRDAAETGPDGTDDAGDAGDSESDDRDPSFR